MHSKRSPLGTLMQDTLRKSSTICLTLPPLKGQGNYSREAQARSVREILAGFSRTMLLLAATLTASFALAEPPQQIDHQDLSYYLKADGTRAAIRTPADWAERRKQIVSGMEQVMGEFPKPSSPVPLNVRVLEQHQGDGFVRQKIAYHTDNENQEVRAWLLVPLSNQNEPHPAMLCLHQTMPKGKDSPAGLADRPSMHYAQELAQRGYVTLSPDYPSLGEHEYDFSADEYESGSMKAIFDNTRAIDLLQSLPSVDPDRIGCIGHSLGGHNSLFTAVFDPRIKAVVTCCGFTSFHKNHGGDIHNWSGPRYMPLIGTKYNFSPDQMSFDFAEVLAAIAPRPLFVVAPLHDSDFDVAGVRDCLTAARPIYELLGGADHLEAVFPDSPHDFPDAERAQAYEFLDHALKSTN